MIGKLLFSILNAVLLIVGLAIALLGFMTYTHAEVPQAGGVPDDRLRQSSFTVAIFGVIVIGTAILGFLGVNKGIRFFKAIYSILLGLAAVAFIALGVYIIINHRKMVESFKENLRTVMKDYYSARQFDAHKEIDKIQTAFKCCGLQSNGSNVEIFGKHPIPKSCCGENIEGDCTLKDAYKVGCDEQLETQLRRLSYPIAGVSFILGIYCIILICFAIFVKNRDDRN